MKPPPSSSLWCGCCWPGTRAAEATTASAAARRVWLRRLANMRPKKPVFSGMVGCSSAGAGCGASGCGGAGWGAAAAAAGAGGAGGSHMDLGGWAAAPPSILLFSSGSSGIVGTVACRLGRGGSGGPSGVLTRALRLDPSGALERVVSGRGAGPAWMGPVRLGLIRCGGDPPVLSVRSSPGLLYGSMYLAVTWS